MVPSDWQEDVLINVLDKIIDYRGQSVPKAESGIPLITARNVRFGYLNFGSEEFIDESQFERWSTRGTPKKGDILFTTEAPLGMACRFPESGTYGVGQRTVTLRTNSKLSSEFLLYFLLSERGQRLIDIRSSGSTAKGIKSSELKKVKILLPVCVDEQRKIAKILSTWDKAISTTERLIENSKQQKKALMQQLLTGKKRLIDESGKPFEVEWEEVSLEEHIESFTNGYAFTASNYKTNGIPILTMGNIGLDGSFNSRISKRNYWESDKSLDKYLIAKGDLLIAMTDVTPDKNLIGRMTIVNIDEVFYLNQRVGLIRLKSSVDTTFLKYLSNDLKWRKYSIAVSASGVQANMSTKDIKKGKLQLPSIEEQQKIASVLSSADKEIELLEQQLADLKQEKKALMQQLLTGKRRVKVDDKEVA